MSLESPAALDSTSKPVSFEFVKELSPGGVASTWLARLSADRSDASSVRLAEVILLNSHITEKPEVKTALLRDVEQAKRLRHPNVIAIESATSEGKEIYVATEIVEGESLAALLAAAGTEGLGTDVALRISLDALAALSAAHALRPEPLVHGELTPQHIFVGIDGVARVSGFGVARTLSKVDPAGAKNQARVGYAAPERVKAMTGAGGASAMQSDPRSDLFSAAVILWEGIAKQRLFAAKMDAAVIQKVLTAPIAPLASLPRVQVPPAVDAALLKALERDPGRRYQAAEELIAALQKAGASAIASHEKVAAVVEKFANKSITQRRAQLASALTAPAATRPGAPATAAAPAAPQAPAAKPAAPAAPAAPKAGAPAAAAKTPSTPAPAPNPAQKRPAASTLLGMPPHNPEAAKPPPPAPPAPPAPAAAKPTEIPKRERLETFTGEVFDEATVDDDWSKDDAGAPPAPPVAAKAPTPAAGKPVAPAAPKPAATAAPKPAAGAAAAKPAAPAAPATAKPAAPAAPAAGKSNAPPATAAAAAAGGKFQVAPPPPSTRPAVKTPLPPAPASEKKPEAKAAAPSPAAVAKAPAAAAAAPKAPAAAAPKAPIAAAKPAAAAPKPAATAAARATGPTAAAPKEAFSADIVEPPRAAQPPSPSPETETSEPSLDEAARAMRVEAYDKIGPGTTLGRYEILTPVAKGGMASVWAARIQGTRGFKKIVAIKTMLPDVSDDPEFESMFLDEARIAARIRHPNVVEIHDLGEQDEVLYIVMEWVDGETLTTLMKTAKASGGIPLPIMLRIASQICAGLHAAHELRGDDGALLDLVHRDVSPGNVLVSSTGFVKVADFGIAKSKGRVHVTQGAGVLKGKAPYLSPEQLRGLTLDRRSDLFSLGTLLYVMASGLHPFRAESEAKTMENIALMKPVPLRDIAPTIHQEFEKIIFKALEKERGSRFATAAEMQKAIDHLASSIGQPTTDEDVGAFVQKTMGDVIKERAKTLRAAITAVDGPLSSQRSSSPNIDPKLIPTITGTPDSHAGPAPTDAQAAPAAAGTSPIFEDITIDEDFSDIQRPADAKPPESAPAAPAPGAGPKVVVSPAAVEAAASEPLADTVAATDQASAGAAPPVGLLDWPSTPQKLPASTPRPPMLGGDLDGAKGAKSDVAVGGGLLGSTSGNGSSEVSLVKDDDLEALAPKRRKLVPVAVGGLLLVGLIIGGIAFSGGDKEPSASAESRTGTEQAANPAPTQAPEAPKPAETAPAAPTEAPAPTAEPAPAAPTTTETAAAAAEPPPTPEPPAVAAPPTPAPVADRPKATPPPVRPVKPAPIKTPPKPGPKTPPKKYNPSGI